MIEPPPPPGQWRTGEGFLTFKDGKVMPVPTTPIVPAFPEDEVRWVEQEAAPWGARIRVPHYVTKWDGWRTWETLRFKSLDQHLRAGDLLFDIGAECGWQSAVLAQLVGPGNMVLFEPDAVVWPCIRNIWRHSGLAQPRAMFQGLVADMVNGAWRSGEDYKNWPNVAFKPVITGHDDSSFFYRTYRSLADPDELAVTTLDDFCTATDLWPDALNIDVEGAELRVLKGAYQLLGNAAPRHVWVSVHPDQMEKYGDTPEQLFEFMAHFDHEYLGHDHEEHHLFTRRG